MERKLSNKNKREQKKSRRGVNEERKKLRKSRLMKALLPCNPGSCFWHILIKNSNGHKVTLKLQERNFTCSVYLLLFL